MIALATALTLAQVWTTGDPARQMVDGILRYLEKQKPKREKQDLAKLLGVIDPRVPVKDLELLATLTKPALRASTPEFDAYAVRWPVLDGLTAEGLLLQPKQQPVRERIVGVPDAGMPPERFLAMQAWAARGAQVLIPVLMDRTTRWSGNELLKKPPALPHREFIYRMAFPFGRHVIGYEVQKALAAVDWFAAQQPAVPIRVAGLGEGAAIAAYAKAIDSRIASAHGAGFHWNRDDVAVEPIDRDIWKIRLAEVEPVQPLEFVSADSKIPQVDSEARLRRQFEEMVEFTQKLIPKSEHVRDAFMKSADAGTLRKRFWDEVVGRIPKSGAPLNVRRKQSYESMKWTGHEIQFDVLPPDVFGYGVLLMPKDIQPGEKRPVVIAQHGLHGRPQTLFQLAKTEKDYDTYRNFAETLADLGFIVYAPQNPYIGDFRPIARHAHPLGLTLFSFVFAQYEKMLDMLAAVPEADHSRIGFYGLSYGGKTALHAPAMFPQFKAVVCSGNFNSWIHKLTSVDAPYSYVFTQEYEILEFGQANTLSHAELAMLISPRPFLVERGHRDGVGADEWVLHEYAKVKRHYDEAGIGDRTGIALFNGAHRIDGAEAVPFLRRWLNW